MHAPIVLRIFVNFYKAGTMSFPVSLDNSKSLGNRLATGSMVGTGKVGQPELAISGTAEKPAELSLDKAKVLGARLNGASMVGAVKPVIEPDQA